MPNPFYTYILNIYDFLILKKGGEAFVFGIQFRVLLCNSNSLGLVSLFNGISTFVGYLTPKQFSYKNSSGTI